MDELTERDLFDGPKLLRGLLLKNSFSLAISKRLNHELIVYRYSINCKTDVLSGRCRHSSSMQRPNGGTDPVTRRRRHHTALAGIPERPLTRYSGFVDRLDGKLKWKSSV